jgi:hypothetical protein
LFSKTGKPAVPPWQLALVTLMQFRENLSDRQAADAVRSRIDWKYLLGLELTDSGFDFSVLSEVRNLNYMGKDFYTGSSIDDLVIRQWAYDENLILHQDEDISLGNEIYFPLLFELAEDRGCPKSRYILEIMDRYIKEEILYQKPEAIKIANRAISFAKKSQREEMKEWVEVLKRIAWYKQRVGSVDRELAIQMGLDLLGRILHQNDIDIVIENDDFWTVGLLTPERADPYSKHLIISKSTGAFSFHPYYPWWDA